MFESQRTWQGTGGVDHHKSHLVITVDKSKTHLFDPQQNTINPLIAPTLRHKGGRRGANSVQQIFMV
jgi:hypothetical protein